MASAKEQEVPSAAKIGAVVDEKIDTAREKITEVAGTVERGFQKAKEDAGKASQVAREKYDETKVQLRTGYDKVRKDMDGLGEDVNQYVRDNPGRSVLIAAGIGFVIGIVARGGRRSD